MAKQLQLRKGTATEHNTFTGANGEVTVDTTNKTLRVHDGSTVGGTMLATSTGGSIPVSQLPDATTTTKGAVVLNNTLTSTSTTQALTAAQGKVLKDTLDLSGQTYQNLTGSRVKGTIYTNSTGRVKYVCVTGDVTPGQTMTITVGGNVVNDVTSAGADWGHTVTFIVPIGQTYKVDITTVIVSWSEL